MKKVSWDIQVVHWRSGKSFSRPPTLYDTCMKRFDMYEGIEKLMKYAKGVSAKTHGFDLEGNDVDIDYKNASNSQEIRLFWIYWSWSASIYHGSIEAIKSSKKIIIKFL